MGKTLLIDTAKIPNNPSTAHSRMAIELSKQLGVELISTSEELRDKNAKEYSIYVIIGSAFYPKTAEIEYFIRQSNNPKIVWINNEYQCSPNSEYARLMKDYYSILISNVEKNKANGYKESYIINLNCLLSKERNEIIHKKYDLIYYGTYRPGRRIYLQKYFSDSQFYLSSSSKNIRKFYQLAGCNARFIDKLDWTMNKETLNLFKYSLYLEDEFTHQNYNHLANRFYEALFCNVVQFFDSNCINTIEQSGYKIDEKYIVESKEELERKVIEFDFNECLTEQIQWNEKALNEKTETLEQLRELLCMKH